MMQAPAPAKRSPWGLRLAAAGAVMLVLGFVVLSSQSSSISAAMDPREQHHDEYAGEGTYITGALNGTCYRFYQERGDVKMTVTLQRIEGSALVGEVLEESTCMLDWQAMTTDGTEMDTIASWTLNTSGEFALKITCDSGCDNATGWLMSIDTLQTTLFESTGLLAGASLCCFGLLITPVALIIHITSKPKPPSRMMMVGEDGQLIPIGPSTSNDLWWGEQQNGNDARVGANVAPPFADTAEQQSSPEFVDGLPDITAGTMLTTEQVYALMRGDVEGAHQHAKTERYQNDVTEATITEAADAAVIAGWDEGVEPKAPSESKPVKASTKESVRPLPKTPSTSSDDTMPSWKEWEEL